MDIQKRLERIIHIFFLLQSRSVVTNKALQERFQIGRRTVYRDLKVLEQAGVPIVNESGEGFSIMEGFRMQPSRFTQEEVLSLMIAEKIMEQHDTKFFKRNLETALIKIKGSFQTHQKDLVFYLDDKLHFNEAFNPTELLPNVVDILLTSILEKKVVKISYLKRDEKEGTVRSIESVGIFQAHNSWYVLGFCQTQNDYRNFRLDRIESIEKTDIPFTRSHSTVSEIRENKSQNNVTKIVIAVEKAYAHFLYWERPTYGFTAEEILDNNVLMHFDCQQNPISFVRWFMRFVDVAKIIEPLHLQHETKQILTAALKKIKGK